ncbi:MAG: hypothetical protein IPQ07_43610 [Myxococcales bacterium]|nr:hypothetical protein [Myxococcales bacterium]
MMEPHPADRPEPSVALVEHLVGSGHHVHRGGEATRVQAPARPLHDIDVHVDASGHHHHERGPQELDLPEDLHASPPAAEANAARREPRPDVEVEARRVGPRNRGGAGQDDGQHDRQAGDPHASIIEDHRRPATGGRLTSHR